MSSTFSGTLIELSAGRLRHLPQFRQSKNALRDGRRFAVEARLHRKDVEHCPGLLLEPRQGISSFPPRINI
jgi:hypothetical protein